MNTEPTDEQINRGIAEWRGWYVAQDDERANNYFLCNPLKIATGEYLTEAGAWIYCPSYTTSHDACREAVRHMTDEQFEEYAVWLDNIVDPKSKHDDCPCMDCLRATSQQEALAIYRTITTKP